MARTIAEKERAVAEIAERLANRGEEPSWRTTEPLRRVVDAFRRSVAADIDVADAVQAARDDGYSWAAIAAMLGVSKQTAQARYGQPPRLLKDPIKSIADIEKHLTGSDLERFRMELAEKSAYSREAALAGSAATDASVKELNAWLEGWWARVC
jgi:hypothetical protein